ncbi:fungal-specific transcription factor domain-containing protein [Xylogone sp. PMI_703]|nr:fungal-specific transcription factor domain-containing protein [Xylogone sp. PMI_703]
MLPSGNLVSPQASFGNQLDLLQRISSIELKLAELTRDGVREVSTLNDSLASLGDAGQSQSYHGVEILGPNSPTSRISESHAVNPSLQQFNTLPPEPVLISLVDTYFLHAHNQPYSYFDEESFRQKLADRQLPNFLILAVLATALRFSNHEYYGGRTREAMSTYAKEAWLAVLSDHMTAGESPDLYVTQATNILSVIDFTGGKTSSGWLKIGLAVRIAQDLHLMREPNEWLPVMEQEERRRVFWSVYLLDKLVSCGRSRPPAIADEDCQVHLPCDEQTFRSGGWKKTTTLNQLLNWNSEVMGSPGSFTLVIMAASALGRCCRYMLHEREIEEIQPWDSRSEFASINSSLLLVEAYLQVGVKSLSDIIAESKTTEGTIDNQVVGHIVLAHAIFHLCHCLLNHPFLLRLRLRAISSKPPPAFLSRAFQKSCDHARELSSSLEEAIRADCRVEASFYSYLCMIAGGILSLNFYSEHAKGEQAPEILNSLQSTIRMLESLSRFWDHASKMYVRFLEFNSLAHLFTHLLDPSDVQLEMSESLVNTMWALVDYGTMSSQLNSTSPKAPSLIHESPPIPSLGLNFDFTTPPPLLLSENEMHSELMSDFNFTVSTPSR